MDILEPFITEKISNHEIFRKTLKSQLSSTIIIPNWTEENDEMVDSMISDVEQGVYLDDEQIDWLKKLKSNFHYIKKQTNQK